MNQALPSITKTAEDAPLYQQTFPPPADSFDVLWAALCLLSLATATKISSTGTDKRKRLEGPESDSKRRRTASFLPLHQTLEAPAEELTPKRQDDKNRK
ncbi:hypothetical protein QBC35DRAFT_506585 [Podospora australis]|uniref:Uncharacterized protein n=1 Tax=Podospora australis TaxID=1536484 RepID=A0AAN6WL96_9PEZI|nr:hypothetical protein QBC35DRAFT_506585 [Podospora australis]